jgi:NAD(P)-dependent dehydrogenase (short-subunit alcohol dehydrogenase family)
MSKTILVTGANRGIGLELVKQYAELECTVLACCRDPNHALELQHLKQDHKSVRIYQLDVSKEDDINRIAEQLKNEKIDILFNNAGIAGQDNPFGEISYSDLITTFKVNTIGPTLLIQALHKQVTHSETKIIVNTSSALGSIELNQDASWFWLSYRISKSGLNAATRSLANQLKSKGVIVIALDPGWVQTDMGGKNAMLTTQECVTNIRHTLENISLNDSGSFIKYDGKQVSW